MRRSGRLNSATAKATLILCPPERYFTRIMALPPRIPNGIKNQEERKGKGKKNEKKNQEKDREREKNQEEEENK